MTTAYRIKPLQWTVTYINPERTELWMADNCFELLTVQQTESGYCWSINGEPWASEHSCESIEDGKRLAEAYYVKRLQTALEPVTPELLTTLERAICWLRRLEHEYPLYLNADAIDKHLQPAVDRARGRTPTP